MLSLYRIGDYCEYASVTQACIFVLQYSDVADLKEELIKSLLQKHLDFLVAY